jgi:hypothetical protein
MAGVICNCLDAGDVLAIMLGVLFIGGLLLAFFKYR